MVVEAPASVVVVAAAPGAVDEVDALAAVAGFDVAVEGSDGAVVDVDELATLTELDVVEEARVLEALPPSMTPVSRRPMKTPAPTMARRTSPASTLLILGLFSNCPLCHTTTRLPPGLDQLVFEGEGGGTGPGRHTDLGEDVGQVP